MASNGEIHFRSSVYSHYITFIKKKLLFIRTLPPWRIKSCDGHTKNFNLINFPFLTTSILHLCIFLNVQHEVRTSDVLFCTWDSVPPFLRIFNALV